MKPDFYTKAVLTVIAIALSVIAFKPLVIPETASAQSAPFAGIQFSGQETSFFDPRTGEVWQYGMPYGGRLDYKFRLTKLGQPMVKEYAIVDLPK